MLCNWPMNDPAALLCAVRIRKFVIRVYSMPLAPVLLEALGRNRHFERAPSPRTNARSASWPGLIGGISFSSSVPPWTFASGAHAIPPRFVLAVASAPGRVEVPPQAKIRTVIGTLLCLPHPPAKDH